MTKRQDNLKQVAALVGNTDAIALRRISMQLHRWHELECGVEGGGVERDEVTGKCTWYNSNTGTRTPHRDMETPALKRLEKIMHKHRAVGLRAYVQGDPRGCALYLIRPCDSPCAEEDNAHYSRGVAVY